MRRWLARLRHDLVKRALIPARDLRELLDRGERARPADVEALARGLLALVDEEGCPATATALWRSFRADLPEAPRAPLDAFERALRAAEERARALPEALDEALAATLALGPAFEALSNSLDKKDE